MISKEFEQRISKIKKPEFKHLNRQIPPEAHTSMYNFHKYWSRKTWNVVGEYIETYCPENGIVYDPFGGSGVTAIEALKKKQKSNYFRYIPPGYRTDQINHKIRSFRKNNGSL